MLPNPDDAGGNTRSRARAASSARAQTTSRPDLLVGNQISDPARAIQIAI